MNKYLYETQIVQEDMERMIADTNIAYDLCKDRTVLVTGANGMLATYCVYTLMYLNEKKNWNVHVLALVRNRDRAMAKFGCFIGDKQFSLIVQDVCESFDNIPDADYIIHAAGSASPRFIKNAPLSIIEANVIGTKNVCAYALRSKAANVLFTSTREVYGKLENVEWITEDDMGVLDPMDSRSCYPESKRMAEQILKSYQVEKGLPFTNVRIAHSYGPGMETENDGRVMSDFMSDVLHNRNIILKSEGTAKRAFCYITDAVRGMFYVLFQGENTQSYNLANETEPMMIRDVARLMTEAFPEKKIRVEFHLQNNNGAYCKYARVGLDTHKLEALGWKPQVSLLDGVKNTIYSFEE